MLTVCVSSVHCMYTIVPLVPCFKGGVLVCMYLQEYIITIILYTYILGVCKKLSLLLVLQSVPCFCFKILASLCHIRQIHVETYIYIARCKRLPGIEGMTSDVV